MTAIACIEDLQKLAKRRVPRMFYDYADSGSWTESTYRANETDLAAIKFRQRVALDVSQRTTEMPMLGQNLPMPVALAPTGLTGMQHADGEILAAKAAAEFGVPLPYQQCRFARLRMLPKTARRRSGFSYMLCATVILYHG